MGNILSLLLLVLPLGLDTFAIAAAVGANRHSGCNWWRISAIFAVFEGATPLIGIGLGASARYAVGSVAEYLSGGLLILLGAYLWWSGESHHKEGDEGAKARQLINARGLALVGLALSISLDEFAIGFSFGLGTDLTAATAIITAIVIQAFVVSQLGLSLGARISEALRQRVERLVGPILIFIGLSPLAEALVRVPLVPSRGAAIASALVIILATAISYRRLTTTTHKVAAMRSGSRGGE